LPVSSPDDVWQSLVMFVGYPRKRQVDWPYGWQLTDEQRVDSTQLNSSLLRKGSRMAKGNTVHENKSNNQNE